jgi:hypothetical protein
MYTCDYLMHPVAGRCTESRQPLLFGYRRPQKERTAQFLKRVTDDWADKALPVQCADEGRVP